MYNLVSSLAYFTSTFAIFYLYFSFWTTNLRVNITLKTCNIIVINFFFLKNNRVYLYLYFARLLFLFLLLVLNLTCDLTYHYLYTSGQQIKVIFSDFFSKSFVSKACYIIFFWKLYKFDFDCVTFNISPDDFAVPTAFVLWKIASWLLFIFTLVIT